MKNHIEFLEIEIKNFLSYGNVPIVIKLNHNGVVLISGANGVGKTSILNAICYSLYGQTLNGCNADDLINNINNQQMCVSITMRKRDDFYKITRARKMKTGAAGNYIKIYSNKECIFDDGHEISLDGTRTTDQMIQGIMGMSFDMFTRIVAISAINTAFLDAPASQQIAFIERIFDLHILAEKATILKDSIKTTDGMIKDQLTKIERIQQEQIRLDQQINNAKQKALQHEQNVKHQIDGYVKQLQLVEHIDIEKERTLYEESTKSKIELAELSTQQKELANKHIKYSKLKEQHQSELLLLKSNKCPYCQQDFYSEEKINECSTKIETYDKTINEMLDYISEIDDSISATSKKHNEAINSMSVDNLEEIINIKNKAASIQYKIDDLHNSKNVYLEQLAELDQIKLDPCDFTGVDKLKNIVEHQQFLLKLLSKKDSFIRKNLLKSNLAYLNQRLEVYLSDLEMPYHVTFNTNMVADIKYLGRELTFNNLSNGQKARVNIALTMAFRDVRQKMSYPVNICFQDEILDMGIDSAGMNSAISMLKKTAKENNTTFFVVTHRDETTSQFDKIIKISMENDFSKLEYC
jgi:DNA repair exonuclease SbcCD ATPase subunit